VTRQTSRSHSRSRSRSRSPTRSHVTLASVSNKSYSHSPTKSSQGSHSSTSESSPSKSPSKSPIKSPSKSPLKTIVRVSKTKTVEQAERSRIVKLSNAEFKREINDEKTNIQRAVVLLGYRLGAMTRSAIRNIESIDGVKDRYVHIKEIAAITDKLFERLEQDESRGLISEAESTVIVNTLNAILDAGTAEESFLDIRLNELINKEEDTDNDNDKGDGEGDDDDDDDDDDEEDDDNDIEVDLDEDEDEEQKKRLLRKANAKASVKEAKKKEKEVKISLALVDDLPKLEAILSNPLSSSSSSSSSSSTSISPSTELVTQADLDIKKERKKLEDELVQKPLYHEEMKDLINLIEVDDKNELLPMELTNELLDINNDRVFTLEREGRYYSSLSGLYERLKRMDYALQWPRLDDHTRSSMLSGIVFVSKELVKRFNIINGQMNVIRNLRYIDEIQTLTNAMNRGVQSVIDPDNNFKNLTTAETSRLIEEFEKSHKLGSKYIYSKEQEAKNQDDLGKGLLITSTIKDESNSKNDKLLGNVTGGELSASNSLDRIRYQVLIRAQEQLEVNEIRNGIRSRNSLDKMVTEAFGGRPLKLWKDVIKLLIQAQIYFARSEQPVRRAKEFERIQDEKRAYEEAVIEQGRVAKLEQERIPTAEENQIEKTNKEVAQFLPIMIAIHNANNRINEEPVVIPVRRRKTVKVATVYLPVVNTSVITDNLSIRQEDAVRIMDKFMELSQNRFTDKSMDALTLIADQVATNEENNWLNKKRTFTELSTFTFYKNPIIGPGRSFDQPIDLLNDDDNDIDKIEDSIEKDYDLEREEEESYDSEDEDDEFGLYDKRTTNEELSELIKSIYPGYLEKKNADKILAKQWDIETKQHRAILKLEERARKHREIAEKKELKRQRKAEKSLKMKQQREKAKEAEKLANKQKREKERQKIKEEKESKKQREREERKEERKKIKESKKKGSGSKKSSGNGSGESDGRSGSSKAPRVLDLRSKLAKARRHEFRDYTGDALQISFREYLQKKKDAKQITSDEFDVRLKWLTVPNAIKLLQYVHRVVPKTYETLAEIELTTFNDFVKAMLESIDVAKNNRIGTILKDGTLKLKYAQLAKDTIDKMNTDIKQTALPRTRSNSR
jgi:hypothetical protein